MNENVRADELYFICIITGMQLSDLIKIDCVYPEAITEFYDSCNFSYTLDYFTADLALDSVLVEVEELENRKSCFKEAFLNLIRKYYEKEKGN